MGQVNDADNSVFAWLRRGNTPDALVLVVANLTPNPHAQYTLNVPKAGVWKERLNTDALIYGGTGMGNMGQVLAQIPPAPEVVPETLAKRGAKKSTDIAIPTAPAAAPEISDAQIQLTLCLPPLATLIFEWNGQK